MWQYLEMIVKDKRWENNDKIRDINLKDYKHKREKTQMKVDLNFQREEYCKCCNT